MYYYFPTIGRISIIDKTDLSSKMDIISSQWEDEITDWGTLYMGVFDWVYSENNGSLELLIPQLASGGSIPKNETASNLFGFDVYGECFLKAIPSKIAQLNSMI